MALQRAFRMRKNSAFQTVKQQGRRTTSRLLSLAWTQNDSDSLHIGFVVSKHVSKHAVVRNYIKRLLGEIIRPFLSALPTGYDLVISARNTIVTLDSEKHTQLVVPPSVIILELTSLLRRSHLLASAASAPESGS